MAVLILLPRFRQSSSCTGQPVLNLLLWVVADDLEGRTLPPDPEQEAGSPILGGLRVTITPDTLSSVRSTSVYANSPRLTAELGDLLPERVS